MTQPTQMADWIKSASPPWLQSGAAEKFMFTLGYMSDLLLEKCNQAQKIRMPGQGDVSQIPYLAADRVLVQGPAESNAAFTGRLQTAFAAWKTAGSRLSALEQLQAYIQGLQPGVAATMPGMTIVGGNASTTVWDSLEVGAAVGAPPAHFTASPANWNWDGVYNPWRSWLVLFMSQVATGLNGTTAAISSTGFGSEPGGRLVSGVWVPADSGTPVNSPFLTLTGLAGLSSANNGQ